jgi:hypothetical protein
MVVLVVLAAVAETIPAGIIRMAGLGQPGKGTPEVGRRFTILLLAPGVEVLAG